MAAYGIPRAAVASDLGLTHQQVGLCCKGLEIGRKQLWLGCATAQFDEYLAALLQDFADVADDHTVVD